MIQSVFRIYNLSTISDVDPFLKKIEDVYPDSIEYNYTNWKPMYDNAMTTLTELMTSGRIRKCNEVVSELDGELGCVVDNKCRQWPSCKEGRRHSYHLEWNISFHDNERSIRNFIPTLKIQIVRIEYDSTSIFIRSRVVVADYCCMIVNRPEKEWPGYTFKDGEVKLYNLPNYGCFVESSPTFETQPFDKHGWGRLCVLVSILCARCMNASEDVHTISDESRKIYSSFDRFKTNVTDNGDKFELQSSDELYAYTKQLIKEFLQRLKTRSDDVSKSCGSKLFL